MLARRSVSIARRDLRAQPRTPRAPIKYMTCLPSAERAKPSGGTGFVRRHWRFRHTLLSCSFPKSSLLERRERGSAPRLSPRAWRERFAGAAARAWLGHAHTEDVRETATCDKRAVAESSLATGSASLTSTGRSGSNPGEKRCRKMPPKQCSCGSILRT